MDSTVKSVIGGVDKFLEKVPHGCGEQTMILLAPIVYAMRYLQRTNQLTPDFERRGIGLMRLGKYICTETQYELTRHNLSE